MATDTCILVKYHKSCRSMSPVKRRAATLPKIGSIVRRRHVLLQAEQHEAQDKGDTAEAEAWRHRLHHYLDQLFHKDQTAGADYHALQVFSTPVFGLRLGCILCADSLARDVFLQCGI